MSSAARCGALESAVVDLQRRLTRSEEVNEHLLAQLAEANLKLTYVLRWFKFQRTVTSPLVDPATGNQSQATEQRTLEQCFLHDRDAFIDHLLKEYDDAHAKAAVAATCTKCGGHDVEHDKAQDHPGVGICKTCGPTYIDDKPDAARPRPVLAPFGAASDQASRTRH